MDARLLRITIACVGVTCFTGANYRSANFVVTAPTADIARQVGMTAEECRKDLAHSWVGYELPRWNRPCPIFVKVGQIGAGGQTRFKFETGADGVTHVFGWDMQVQGTLERVLDSVIPHEVSHTIFASHFRRGLPRWADEGAATLSEHESERNRQLLLLGQVLRSGKPIPLRKLFAMKEYPRQMRDVLTLYAEGYSLAEFLVQQQGRQRYMKFLEDGHKHGWTNAIRANYRHTDIESLEKQWRGWFMAGSPRLDANTMLADASDRDNEVRIRSQSPDPVRDNSRSRSASRSKLPAFPFGRRETRERNSEKNNLNTKPDTQPAKPTTRLQKAKNALLNFGRDKTPRSHTKYSGRDTVAFQKVIFPVTPTTAEFTQRRLINLSTLNQQLDAQPVNFFRRLFLQHNEDGSGGFQVGSSNRFQAREVSTPR